MESAYNTMHTVLAASEFVFTIGAVVAFLFGLFFGKVSIRSIRDDWTGKEPGETR